MVMFLLLKMVPPEFTSKSEYAKGKEREMVRKCRMGHNVQIKLTHNLSIKTACRYLLLVESSPVCIEHRCSKKRNSQS